MTTELESGLPRGLLSPGAPGNLRFTLYTGNPVLPTGPEGAWDGSAVALANVIAAGGVIYLFYMGIEDWPRTPGAIGYATSRDGFAFTKFEGNPVLTGSGTGFDSYTAGDPTVLVEDGTWILYYSGIAAPDKGCNGAEVGRATAPEPSGPWTRSPDPVLRRGGPGEWDSGFVTPNCVIRSDDGYVMYYSGGIDFDAAGFAIGRATSPDGITWTKHNNPATSDPPYAESDPVLGAGAGEWDGDFAWGCSVHRTEQGWEMYYCGGAEDPTGERWSTGIGHARSGDGVAWTKHRGNPVLRSEDALPGWHLIEYPSVLVRDATVFMYFDHGLRGPGIGLATSAA